MIAYAGIGSRTITSIEKDRIKLIAKIMAKAGYILYSGNAEGSDIAFQEGSDGKCVIMLPWKGFNEEEYDYTFSRDYFILGDSREGIESINKDHPAPTSLSRGGRALMARNYHQIHGYREYPKVSLVIYCANERNGQVEGGTGQAIRIARNQNIPTINIRLDGWKEKIKELLVA